MKNYESLLRVREELAGGEGPWMWIKEDNGAWDGPRTDWENDHIVNIKKYVKDFDCVIQAGGNQGMYPLLLAKMFKVVYTFEPDPLNFHCLVNNCQHDSIVKFNAALAEKNKMIHVNRGSLTNTGTHTVGDGGYCVALSIDSIPFDKVDLIHLDLEGYENNAIRGSLKTIEKFKPVILAERSRNSEIENMLSPFGYTYKGQSVSDAIFTVDSQ